jgi:hypothetical protein
MQFSCIVSAAATENVSIFLIYCFICEFTRVDVDKTLSPGEEVTFETTLSAGDLDVRAWFDNQSDASGLASGLPAFYMYVEKKI